MKTNKKYVLRKFEGGFYNFGKVIHFDGDRITYQILKTDFGREGEIGDKTEFRLNHSPRNTHKFLTEKELLAWMI